MGLAVAHETRKIARSIDWCNRSRRVIVLVVGIMVLSLADLVITLAFLNANSMMEANPIAAYLIRSTQSPWALAAYKVLTVGICVALLYRLRKHRAGEIAAWCAIGILTVMSVMWHSYAKNLDDSDSFEVTQLASVDTADDGRLGFQ